MGRSAPFPRSLLAASDARSLAWRNDFMRALLERDIPQRGITVPTPTLRRFWTMVAQASARCLEHFELGRRSVSGLEQRQPTERQVDSVVPRIVWFARCLQFHVNAPDAEEVLTEQLHEGEEF